MHAPLKVGRVVDALVGAFHAPISFFFYICTKPRIPSRPVNKQTMRKLLPSP